MLAFPFLSHRSSAKGSFFGHLTNKDAIFTPLPPHRHHTARTPIDLIQTTRQQQEHASEVASLEKDLHGAGSRFRDARHRLDLLRDSREAAVELAASAYRRRRQGTMIAAAASEGGEGGCGRDGDALVRRWCFWGGARVAQGGRAAAARRARRVEAEKELPGVREMLSAAVERARGAEAERDRHGSVLFPMQFLVGEGCTSLLFGAGLT